MSREDAVSATQSGDDVLDTDAARESVIRGSVTRTLGYVAGSAVVALVLPFQFRYLGVSGVERYATVLTLVTVLAGLVEVGLTGVSLRLYSLATAAERPMLIRELLTMRLAVMGLGAALIVAFTAIGGYPSGVLVGVLIGAAAVLIENIASTYNVALTAHLRWGWIAISNVARQIGAALLAGVMIVIHAPLVWFYVVLVPASVLQLLISIGASRKYIPLWPKLKSRVWPRLMRESLSYIVAMALGFVYFRVPMIEVSLIKPGATTGYFGAAFRLVEQMTLVSGFVLTAVVPLLTRSADDPVRHARGMSRLAEVSIFVGGGMAAVMASSSQLLIAILGGAKFSPAANMFCVLSAVLLLRFLSTAWGYGLLSTGQYRYTFAANGVATITSIVAGIVLVQRFGGVGAAVATVASEAALCLTYGVALRSAKLSLGLGPRSVRITLVCVAATALSFAVPAGSVLRVGVCVLALAGGLAVTRAVPHELVSLLKGRLGSTPA